MRSLPVVSLQKTDQKAINSTKWFLVTEKVNTHFNKSWNLCQWISLLCKWIKAKFL